MSKIGDFGSMAQRRVFCIWAEENGGLANNGVEWAFGNGANTPQDQGVVIGLDSMLFAGGLSINSGTATVGVFRNGTQVATITAGTGGNPTTALEQLAAPVAFAAGDVLGFRTVTAAGTSAPAQVVAWLHSN